MDTSFPFADGSSQRVAGIPRYDCHMNYVALRGDADGEVAPLNESVDYELCTDDLSTH